MPYGWGGPGEGPVIPALPTGPLGAIVGFVQFIMQLLGFGQVDLRPVVQAVNNTWANLIVGATFLYNAIGWITGFLKKLISLIVDSLKLIIKDILHGHLLQALKDIQKLFHDLKALFQPILDYIDKLRRYYYKYIYKWVQLVQNILSFVRVVLSAFRLLGAKWAAKLDADIQRIQGYITGVMQAIIGTLNQASTWLNFALDPLGIVRRDFFSRSMFGSLLQTRNAINFGKDRFLTASEAQNTQEDGTLRAGGAAVLTRNADGSVTYSAASQRLNDQMDKAYAALGPVPTLH